MIRTMEGTVATSQDNDGAGLIILGDRNRRTRNLLMSLPVTLIVDRAAI